MSLGTEKPRNIKELSYHTTATSLLKKHKQSTIVPIIWENNNNNNKSRLRQVNTLAFRNQKLNASRYSFLSPD